MDNFSRTKVKTIEEEDRVQPLKAYALFDSLFPGWKVVVINVFELVAA